MFPSSFVAVVPMLCVTAAGIAALLAEALREPGERMPIAGLGVIGLAGAGVSAVQLWGRNASSMGVVAADNFGLFVTLVLTVIGLFTMLYSSESVGREHLPGGEYYALTLFSIAGMILMGVVPNLFLLPMERSVDRIVQAMQQVQPVRARDGVPDVSPSPASGVRFSAFEGREPGAGSRTNASKVPAASTPDRAGVSGAGVRLPARESGGPRAVSQRHPEN